jgi:lysylphosphatidylglycerol synthetase-like protein (DUF2156 family)
MSVETPDSESLLPDPAESDRPTPRGAPGVLALIAAAVFATVHGVAIAAGVAGDFRTATILAWVAIVGTAVTLVMAVVAFARARGRLFSGIAIVLSLVANPFVLTSILSFFESSQS